MAVLTEGSGCFDKTGDVFLHGDAQSCDSTMVYHPCVIGHELTQQPHILFEKNVCAFILIVFLKFMTICQCFKLNPSR